MSSVLHPIGPEQPQTYWLRRVAVVVAAVVVVAVIVWAVWPRSGQTATPAEPGSVSPAPTTPVSTKPSPSPTSGSSLARPSASPSSRASSSSSASASTSSASASPSAASPTAPAVTACDAEEVRVTLTGPGKVKADDTTTFKVSVINGSAVTCTIDLTRSTFEVKIYSGTDRIWSTVDCAKWLAAKPERRLDPEKAYAWSIKWPGQRSASGCKLSDGLRGGTYVATAQLSVAKSKSKPVQVVMRLR